MDLTRFLVDDLKAAQVTPNGYTFVIKGDRLFDSGLISFKNSGDLLVSKSLDLEVLEKWHIPHDITVGKFRPEQNSYLEYHRDLIFKSA